jgi:hypothetical protein
MANRLQSAGRRLSIGWLCVVVAVGLVLHASQAGANPDANRLYEDLMMSYNRFVRPVQNDSDTLLVKLGLKLSQLIDVVSGVCVAAGGERAQARVCSKRTNK